MVDALEMDARLQCKRIYCVVMLEKDVELGRQFTRIVTRKCYDYLTFSVQCLARIKVYSWVSDEIRRVPELAMAARNGCEKRYLEKLGQP